MLAGLGAGLAFFHDPLMLAGGAALAGAALLLTGVAARALWSSLKGPTVIVGCIGLFECASLGPESAVLDMARLLILIGLAHAVAASSTVSAMTAAIETALRPAEWIGLLNAERAGLTLTLAIRFVPLIMDEVAAIREAQIVRGLDRSIVALAVPLVVKIILRAQELADAIDLRGPPPRSEIRCPNVAGTRVRADAIHCDPALGVGLILEFDAGNKGDDGP
ncbi:energy-coupling factor transporter transmembrane component T family protein [Bradyrhizobium oligotrophicum]|uniref:energy-coupling factor transporter transmembrane component T family protein n=1 Tax=Bradyrhizobium oligotrophicum TaxID=44255 RepID=UPI003EBB1C74